MWEISIPVQLSGRRLMQTIPGRVDLPALELLTQVPVQSVKYEDKVTVGFGKFVGRKVMQ